MGVPEAGSWEITSVENHPKGGSFFFLKFSDTRFNSHSMVSSEIVCDDPDTKFKFTFSGNHYELPRIKV